MRTFRNVGIIDGNVRKFLALPCLVLAVTSALAYHEYGFSLGSLLVGAYFFASGVAGFSLMYRVVGLSTQGGPHRVR